MKTRRGGGDVQLKLESRSAALARREDSAPARGAPRRMRGIESMPSGLGRMFRPMLGRRPIPMPRTLTRPAAPPRYRGCRSAPR
ncbi:hypothetical protein [Lysobacter gummosus]|uniref:hypothetical protein n=1 Tax=Lysobacter gummosus TaxID=262324 RepID=UPI00363A6ECB